MIVHLPRHVYLFTSVNVLFRDNFVFSFWSEWLFICRDTFFFVTSVNNVFPRHFLNSLSFFSRQLIVWLPHIIDLFFSRQYAYLSSIRGRECLLDLFVFSGHSVNHFKKALFYSILHPSAFFFRDNFLIFLSYREQHFISRQFCYSIYWSEWFFLLIYYRECPFSYVIFLNGFFFSRQFYFIFWSAWFFIYRDTFCFCHCRECFFFRTAFLCLNSLSYFERQLIV